MESVEGSMRRLLDDIAMASQQAVKSMSEQMLETVIQANINQDQKSATSGCGRRSAPNESRAPSQIASDH